MAKRIESQHNAVIKRLKGLQMKKNRDKEGVFVAEGLRFVSEIPEAWAVDALAVTEEFAAENDISQWEAKAPVYLLPLPLFLSITDTENPQGILAVCRKQEADVAKIWQRKAPFVILAEELNDPGNLGTVIRTADACGADAIFLSKGSVDVYNAKVLRATMGSIFHIPIFQNVALTEIAETLKAHGVALYAAHLRGECYPYDLPLCAGCGFLIGNEARGLREESAALCDRWVKIPMPGRAESLNASIAAGILMYEVVRQRLC